MSPADPDVLYVEDVAKLLGLGRNVVYDAAGANKIPCRRVGRRFLFSRSRVMEWLKGEDRDPRSKRNA